MKKIFFIIAVVSVCVIASCNIPAEKPSPDLTDTTIAI